MVVFSPLLSVALQMVDDMTKIMFECEGEPKQLNAEIGHMFIVDRGKKTRKFFFLAHCATKPLSTR